MASRAHPLPALSEPPLDPDLLRIIEALAEADAAEDYARLVNTPPPLEPDARRDLRPI